MYRFVVLIWNRANLAAAAVASRLGERIRHSGSDLSLALSVEDMIVYTLQPLETGLTSYILGRDRGIVLGRLFPTVGARRDGAGRLVIDDDLSHEWAADGGRALRDRYWGSYVAFLRSPDNGHNYVIRDCSGWLPCFRLRHSDVEIIFSDMNDLTPLELPPLYLNWQFLAAYLSHPRLHIRECGLIGITEVLAGECVEFSQSSVRQFPIWDPRRVVLGRSIERYEQAQSELQAATQNCIDAWSGVYRNILLSLSGGLDSAIVLGCIKRASVQPTVTGFNWCTENTADDERRYARLAATQAGIPLIENAWSDPRFTERIFSIPKGPKVYPGDVYWWLEVESRRDIALRTRAEAVWTGQGGDQLFWAPRTLPIAADYVAHRGVDFGLARVIADAARLSSKSHFSILRSALSVGRSGARSLPDDEYPVCAHFVNREALPPNYAEYVAHPWDGWCERVPPIKQMQIHFLADLLNRHKHMPGAEHAYQRHPLQSQPLMEVCLQIPLYVHTQGGRRRALARSAFWDRVPAEIIAREDKGESMARVRSMIRENEEFLRDHLLSGILVRQRIVSKKAIESILVDGQPYRPEHYWPLLAWISAEVWAQTWKDARLPIAA